MKHLNKLDHIGYAVKDINETAQVYINGGWVLSDVYEEEVQHARIAFLRKDGFPTIELVAPLEGKSPVDTFLQKVGVTPYHMCYVVADIDEAVEDLYDEGFKPLFMPVESTAMGNRKICYLFNAKTGYIELVSSN